MKTFLTITAMALMSTGAYADCVPLTANYAGAPALQCVGDDGGNGQTPAHSSRVQVRGETEQEAEAK